MDVLPFTVLFLPHAGFFYRFGDGSPVGIVELGQACVADDSYITHDADMRRSHGRVDLFGTGGTAKVELMERQTFDQMTPSLGSKHVSDSSHSSA